MKHLGKERLQVHCNILVASQIKTKTDYCGVFYSSRGNEEGTFCDETELDINGSFLTFRSDSNFCCFVLALTTADRYIHIVYIWCWSYVGSRQSWHFSFTSFTSFIYLFIYLSVTSLMTDLGSGCSYPFDGDEITLQDVRRAPNEPSRLTDPGLRFLY